MLVLILGCTSSKPSVGLEVIFHNKGCSGISESESNVQVGGDGLNVVSNILSNDPCYKLTKAEISRMEDNVTVFFTFIKESGECISCIGVQSLVYRITGDELNKSGVNVVVISYLGNQTETNHTFVS